MSYYLTREERWDDLASGLVGVLDIIAGILIYSSRSFNFTSNPIIILLSLFYFCLGIWTLGINIQRKNYLEWKGIIDIANAVVLFLVFSGSVFGAFEAIGIVIVIKGILGLILVTTSEH